MSHKVYELKVNIGIVILRGEIAQDMDIEQYDTRDAQSRLKAMRVVQDRLRARGQEIMNIERDYSVPDGSQFLIFTKSIAQANKLVSGQVDRSHMVGP